MASPVNYLPLASFPNASEKDIKKIEQSALSDIMKFGMLQLFAVVVAVALTFLSITGSLSIISAAFSGSPIGSFIANTSTNFYYNGYIEALIIWTILFFSLIYLWLAFRSLSRIDKVHFLTPKRFALFILSGLSVSLALIVAIEAQLFFSLGDIPTGIYIISEVLLTVGFIGAEAYGLWRVSNRFDSLLLTMAAVFCLFAPIIWQILVVIGAYNSKIKNLPPKIT